MKLKFGRNMSAYKGFMQTEFGARGHVTKTLQAENWQKVDKFNPIFLRKHRYLVKNGLWFLSTLSTTFFGYANLPQI